MEEKESRERGLFIVKLNLVDYLTLSGVFWAGIAVALILQERLELALAFLYLAVISDAFDGVLARKYGLTRDFGRYLDGFVDTVDYLIAPALFFYAWGFSEVWQGLLLLVFICCGFIRLSVFNEIGNIKDEDNGLSYLGAPVFWSTLLLGPTYIVSTLIGKEILFSLMTILIPLFSLLMLHNGRYHKFKNPKRMLVALLSLSVMFFLWDAYKQGFYFRKDSQTISLHVATGLLASIPVIVGGILHMLVVRFDLLSFLKIPISQKLFGSNKTIRGFVVMPFSCMIGFSILVAIVGESASGFTINFSQYSIWISGLLIGLAYVLAELPNSYIKRRLGVAPGAVPQSNARLFILVDQLDSGILCLLCYWFFWNMPALTCLVTLVMTPIIALSIKKLLYLLKLKNSST